MCARYDEDDSGTLCARGPGHDGPCRNRAGYVFDTDDVQADENTDDSAEATMSTTRVDALVDELGAILANPGHPAHAYARIRQADHRFDRLDAHMRTGGALPSTWRAARSGVTACLVVTSAYDALSEALRERGGVVAAWSALDVARTAWERLDECMRDGIYPEPWVFPDTGDV